MASEQHPLEWPAPNGGPAELRAYLSRCLPDPKAPLYDTDPPEFHPLTGGQCPYCQAPLGWLPSGEFCASCNSVRGFIPAKASGGSPTWPYLTD